MSSSSASTDASNAAAAAKLALMYSRMVETEAKKEKTKDIQEELRKITEKSIENIEINNIEMIFRDVTSNVKAEIALVRTAGNTEAPHSTLFPAETLTKLRVLFLAEQQFTDTLARSLVEKLEKWKKLLQDKELLVREKTRKREEQSTRSARIFELEDICRNLQKLAKEKDEQRSHVVEAEKEKTEHLRNECVQSIQSVLGKIEEEESDLLNKEKENEDLKLKLEQFMYHMNLRREKIKSEEKKKDLEMQLEQARKAQIDFFQEQERLRAQSYKSRIHHLHETIFNLKQQLNSFSGKFGDFESTLEKSAQVLETVDEREIALKQLLDKLSEDSATLKKKAAEADVKIITTMEQKRTEEGELVKAKANYEKLEKKCRMLMKKRQDMLKKQAAEEKATIAPTVAPSETSTMSYITQEAPEKVQEAVKSRINTPSPTSSSSSSASSSSSSSSTAPADGRKISTPSRRVHHFVMSSSSSPSRPAISPAGLVGEGSPVSSPTTAKKGLA